MHAISPYLRELYGGERGRLWGRLEDEAAASYPEENAVAGRRAVRALLIDWLGAAAGARVLDLGCGSGTTAAALAAAGAKVAALDARLQAELARRGGVIPVVGDLREVPLDTSTFDAVLLQEVVEDYPPEEQPALLEAVAGLGVPRWLLVLRERGDWQRLSDSPVTLPGLATADPVRLLRVVHLRTPYRLVRRLGIRRRNYRAVVCELKLCSDGAGV